MNVGDVLFWEVDVLYIQASQPFDPKKKGNSSDMCRQISTHHSFLSIHCNLIGSAAPRRLLLCFTSAKVPLKVGGEKSFRVKTESLGFISCSPGLQKYS